MLTESNATDRRVAEKRDAQAFLLKLHQALESVPAAAEMELNVSQTVREAKANSQLHLKLPEAAFLNKFVVPTLATMLVAQLSEAEARKALLDEYYRCMPSLASGAPGHTVGHPFTKIPGVKLEETYKRWTDGKKALPKSWPDFAVRAPFPHKILFEGKYFSKGSLTHAQRELVADIYQAFFYRGLAFVEQTVKGQAAWDYDYACLVAYDASPEGTLKRAWTALPKSVQNSFWNSANIYVMILGGQGRPAK
jgi:hypothetical protein